MPEESFKRKLTGNPVQIQLLRYLTILIVVAALFGILYGCASTKPNLSIVHDTAGESDKNSVAARAILAEMLTKNELLAIELGKLPELQDGVSLQEVKGLQSLVKLYGENQSAFDRAFEEMFRIGIPEVRKYCSPLQALFWLAEDGRLSEENNPLVDYSLEGLLNEAWRPEGKLELSKNESKKVIDGIKNEDQRKDYYAFLDRLKVLNKIILLDYRKKPRMFSKEARAIIKNSSRENLRWLDFNVVVERLNAPELVDYYERRRFRWVHPAQLPCDRQKGCGAHYVFKHNQGNCLAISQFTVYVLRKGGYKAELLPRGFRGMGYGTHIYTLFEMRGKKYIMDNGRPGKRGIIPWAEYHYE